MRRAEIRPGPVPWARAGIEPKPREPAPSAAKGQRGGTEEPARSRRPALTYALLIFLSCFLELGLVVDAIVRDRPLGGTFAPLGVGTFASLSAGLGVLLLAFHVATLLAHLLTVPRLASSGSLALGALLLLAHPGGVVGAGAGVFLARFGLQHLRNDLKACLFDKPSGRGLRASLRAEALQAEGSEPGRRAQTRPDVRYKALPRLAGFALAFLYSPPAFAALSAVTLAAYLRTLISESRGAGELGSMGAGEQRSGGECSSAPPLLYSLAPRLPRRIYLVMAAHSAHYFAFGYGVPILFARWYGFPAATLGLIYAAGWIGYYLVSQWLSPSPRAMAWGHLTSALAILILAASLTPGLAPSTSPALALLAWTVTGFGGGTIFMLARLRSANPYDPATMELWDNGANIVGVLLFLWAWGQGAPALGFLAAAALALAAAWLSAGLAGVWFVGWEGRRVAE
ncbi:MAG: hypothetical protein D6775_09045 [Caldilineae bacterium]|nr:MAG: hypothetical protein D6775_09045 [Caldilineae bacterium]